MDWDNLRKQAAAALSGAVTVAAGAVSRAAEVAKDLAEDLTSFKCLKGYKLAGHIATAGPNNTWKIFTAISTKPGAVMPEVSVWILNKKELTDMASRGGRARGFDLCFEQQRRGCAQMLKIKHPGVVKLLEPMEESSSQMVMVTEPLFGSLANCLSGFRDVPSANEERQAVRLSQLEMKYGLQHLAETVQFLHQDAATAHCNINPESVLITKDGSWKLAGFAFATGIDYGGQAVVFEYASSQPALWEEVTQPPLAYTAPELVANPRAHADMRPSAACDVFSLAAITYELLVGSQLLPVGSAAAEHAARAPGLCSSDLSSLPGALQPTLRGMLAPSPGTRLAAAAFSTCSWFQDDMLLRALRFLDTLLQRDSSQKVAFLRDLATLWSQFDARLLRSKVLPRLVAEMRSELVALAALPVVLAIMGGMSPADFEASGILPVLRPVFEAADGEVLLALVRNIPVFHRLMQGDAMTALLVPLMLRACDSGNTKAQEEVLRAMGRLAATIHYGALKDQLVPRVVNIALRTTSLVVRTHALGVLTQAVVRLDRDSADKMLDLAGQITAVDRSAGTAMATLRLADAVAKHYGAEVAATRVLPLLGPMLMSPSLSAQQFGSVLSTIRQLLELVQQARQGSLVSEPAVPGGAADGGLGVASPKVARIGSGGSGASPWDMPASNGEPLPAKPSGMAGSSFGAGGANSLPAWDTPAAAPSPAKSGALRGGVAGGGHGLGAWDVPSPGAAGSSPAAATGLAGRPLGGGWGGLGAGGTGPGPGSSGLSSAGSGGLATGWPGLAAAGALPQAAGGLQSSDLFSMAPAAGSSGRPGGAGTGWTGGAGAGSSGTMGGGNAGWTRSGAGGHADGMGIGGAAGGGADALFGGLTIGGSNARNQAPAGTGLGAAAPAPLRQLPPPPSSQQQQQQHQPQAAPLAAGSDPFAGLGLRGPTATASAGAAPAATSRPGPGYDPFALPAPSQGVRTADPFIAPARSSSLNYAPGGGGKPGSGAGSGFDPFGSLVAGGAAAAPDPFASLVGAGTSGRPAAPPGGDPFASLAGGYGNTARQPAPPGAKLPAPPQQQQQPAWSANSGSLI